MTKINVMTEGISGPDTYDQNFCNNGLVLLRFWPVKALHLLTSILHTSESENAPKAQIVFFNRGHDIITQPWVIPFILHTQDQSYYYHPAFRSHYYNGIVTPGTRAQAFNVFDMARGRVLTMLPLATTTVTAPVPVTALLLLMLLRLELMLLRYCYHSVESDSIVFIITTTRLVESN